MTDKRTKEILNWLDSLANDYSVRLDKYHKRLVEDAIKIIASKSLGPVDDVIKFHIPPDLENAGGYIPSVENKQ